MKIRLWEGQQNKIVPTFERIDDSIGPTVVFELVAIVLDTKTRRAGSMKHDSSRQAAQWVTPAHKQCFGTTSQ
jgi:hypothetical protein